MFAYINSDFVALDKAFLHVSDLSIQRGYGIFDFLKVEDGHPFFIDDYLDRFYNSASIMRLPVPLKRSKLIAVVRELISRNNLKYSGIKMILTGGYSVDGYQPHDPNLVITQQQLVLPSPELINQGVSIITHEYVRDIPGVKTINYSMGIWLIENIKNANAYDVLYVKDGIVSEFPRSNFFIVTKDNVVVTPDKNVLLGVTRKNVLHVASSSYRVEERDVNINELWDAQEAFITSTTKRVLPVVRVDHQLISDGKPGKVSRDLLAKLIQLELQDRAVAL
jgi:branched-chain amino acid aminotransferase